MTTKLELINRVLDATQERRIQSSSQPLGNIVVANINLALSEVCSTANWVDTRATAVATWADSITGVTNVATVAGTLQDFRVTAVKTQFTATQKTFAGFVSRDEFDSYPITSYASGTSYPLYWTYSNASNKVRCNPYPSDAGGIAKVFIDYQVIIKQPTLDSDSYTVPERFLKLVEMKAASMYCLKHLGDFNLYTVYDNEYENLRNLLIGLQNGENSYNPTRQPQLVNSYMHRLAQPE